MPNLLATNVHQETEPNSGLRLVKGSQWARASQYEINYHPALTFLAGPVVGVNGDAVGYKGSLSLTLHRRLNTRPSASLLTTFCVLVHLTKFSIPSHSLRMVVYIHYVEL